MKRKYSVDIVSGTVNNIGHKHFDIVTKDMYIYRIVSEDKKMFALDPELGDVVWLYRVKALHKVIDLVTFESNPELGDSQIEYEMELESD